jgi:hypothetical protein
VRGADRGTIGHGDAGESSIGRRSAHYQPITFRLPDATSPTTGWSAR